MSKKIFKQFISLLLIAAMNITAMTACTASSTETPQAVNGISVTINGKILAFDQPPVMLNSRVLVPLRAIFEAFNSEVFYEMIYEDYYDDDDETAITTKIHAINQNFILQLTDGDQYNYNTSKFVKGWKIEYRTSKSDFINIEYDVPPTIINGRTLVPVRVISEILGATVDWDNDTQTVIINGDIPDMWKTQEEVDKMNAFEYEWDSYLDKKIDAYLKEHGLAYVPMGGGQNQIGYDFHGKYIVVLAYVLETSMADTKFVKFYYDGEVGIEAYNIN